MSGFVDQIFSAMMTATHHGTMRPLEWEQAIKMLAPRVAAALEAAVDRQNVNQNEVFPWEEQALAALRGAP